MGKVRFTYLDTAKAYLIFLVILGHILIVLNPEYDKLYFSVVQEFIYVFHMPAFYVIHGILFNNEKWKSVPTHKFVKKRAYSLLVPYLFFETIGIFWRAAFQHQSVATGFLNMITIRCNVGADWFLPAMFTGSLLFIIYIKHPNRIYGIASTVICFVVPMFMSGSQITIVLGRGMLAYGFMMIGNLAKNMFVSEKSKSVLWLSTSLIITGITAIICLKFGGNDFYTCTVNNPIMLIIGGASGTLLILGISRILYCNVITTIGKHTLTIMGTHQLVIYALTSLISGMYGGGIGKGIILLLVIVLFEIPVVYLIDRYLPFFVGRKRENK